MTDDNKDFLKFLIHEDIYLIEKTGEYSSENPLEHNSKPKVSQEKTATSIIEIVLQSPIKSIVILYENRSDVQMPQSDHEYLGKILGAVKKSFDDVQLINTAMELTTDILKAKCIISFDSSVQLLNKYNLPYQLIKDDSQIIKADKLSTIAQSPELRKKLWGVLQEMFLV